MPSLELVLNLCKRYRNTTLTMRFLLPKIQVSSSDGVLLLDSHSIEQWNRFRLDIERSTTSVEKYSICIRARDDLLAKHTGVEILAGLIGQTIIEENLEHDAMEEQQWSRFQGVARCGSSTCLTALRTIGSYWGTNFVQQYGLISKGEKYCNSFRTAVRKVPDREDGIQKLNQLILYWIRTPGQSKVLCARNPITQVDLKWLATWSHSNSLIIRSQEIPNIDVKERDLPDGFVLDEFGLIAKGAREATGLGEDEQTGASEDCRRCGDDTENSERDTHSESVSYHRGQENVRLNIQAENMEDMEDIDDQQDDPVVQDDSEAQDEDEDEDKDEDEEVRDEEGEVRDEEVRDEEVQDDSVVEEVFVFLEGCLHGARPFR